MKALRLCTILFVFLLFPAISVSAEVETWRVFDEAGLLTEAEIEVLENDILDLQNQLNADVAIITTDDAKGLTTFQFLDYIYDQKELGFGPNRDGVLFVMDMDNREVDLITDGKMVDFLSNIRIDSVLDDAFNAIVEGDYFGTATAFIEGVGYYFEEDIAQEEVPEPEILEEEPIELETEVLEEESGNILIMALIAGAVGLVFNIFIRISYSSAEASSSELRGKNQLSLSVQRERFINSRIRKTPRPKDPPKETTPTKNKSKSTWSSTNSRNTKRPQQSRSYGRDYYEDECRGSSHGSAPTSSNESNRGGGRGRSF